METMSYLITNEKRTEMAMAAINNIRKAYEIIELNVYAYDVPRAIAHSVAEIVMDDKLLREIESAFPWAGVDYASICDAVAGIVTEWGE